MALCSGELLFQCVTKHLQADCKESIRSLVQSVNITASITFTVEGELVILALVRRVTHGQQARVKTGGASRVWRPLE